MSALSVSARRRAGARINPRVVATLVVLAGAIVLPFGISEYWLSTLVFVLIAAIGAVGLGVLTGYTGQISLGHSFFLAVGAYTAAVLGGNDHLTAAIWLPAAGIIAGLCGALAGPTALRLRGLYLAIVTIGLVYIGLHIWTNVPIGDITSIVYGVLIIVFFVLEPRGLVGIGARLWGLRGRFRKQPQPTRGEAT